MAPVTVLPLGVEIEVPEGQSVMMAAYAAGYDWPTECGGAAECGTCVAIIRDGLENCGSMPQDEVDALERTMGLADPSRRLACRLIVTGPVTLTKRGVRLAEGDAS
jgi:ferredoxin